VIALGAWPRREETFEAEWLYETPQWINFLASFIIILAAADVGRRLGRRIHRRDPEAGGSHVGTLQSALLGLLSLMIGFTFSLALSRFEARKAAVVDEANAIGTTVLRAKLLSEPIASETTGLLHRCVDLRIALSDDDATPMQRSDAIHASLQLQDELWRQGVALMARDPTANSSRLFLEALNEISDVHTRRLAADRNHVPEAAFLLLYAIATVALGFTGFAGGAMGKRSVGPNTVMALTIAMVIALVADLDRPRHGLITVGREPLIDLQTGLASTAK
jgi:hypothetical protein